MPPRRPPSAVALVMLLALGCANAAGETAPTDNGELASLTLAAEPAAVGPVSAPPPVAVEIAPAVIPPEARVPEITALALARQVLAVKARRLDAEQREKIARMLASAEQELDLDVLLVLALIHQESSFNPRAVGPRGSRGLMQIRPWVGEDIARRYGVPWDGDDSLYEPVLNVRLGTYYFAEMLAMFSNDPLLALAAYNMGPYRVLRLMKAGRDPRPEYVDKVFGHYDLFYHEFRATQVGWGG